MTEYEHHQLQLDEAIERYRSGARLHRVAWRWIVAGLVVLDLIAGLALAWRVLTHG